MAKWDFLVYFSSGVVYLTVVATIIGWIKYEKEKKEVK